MKLALAMTVFAVVSAGRAIAADAPLRDGRSQPLVVAVVSSPPFAIKEPDGTWTGLSVELWREVSDKLGLSYQLREMELSDVDGQLQSGSVDVAIGAIAVTAEDEIAHDFSQPYYSTGLGFAEPVSRTPSLATTIESLWNSQLLRIVGMIAIATIVVGVLVAVIERRQKEGHFGGPLRDGIATGVWWAAVTMTTVGYGDATPKTAPGRSLALIWMFVGVVVVAIFTATVTSILTVGTLHSTVQQAADLSRLRLGAIAGGAGPLYLESRHLSFRLYATHEAALDSLAHHQVDAVIANVPSLRYLIKNNWQGILHTSPMVLEPLNYAFALPTGSPLREGLDRALLSIIEQGRWEDLQQRYLGHTGPVGRPRSYG